MSKQCMQCNTEFTAKRSDAKYCSTPCYKKSYSTKNSKKIKQQKREYYHKRKKENSWYSSYVAVERKTLKCASCNTSFSPMRSDTKCCSFLCSNRLWRSKNKKHIKQDQQRRYREDMQRRISTNIRSRVNKALKGAHKPSSIIGNLGCTSEQLKKHLESQFAEGMSWDNYGDWHIDHIKPLASYNLQDHKDFNKACHYTNLQPLWAQENLKKGAKL